MAEGENLSAPAADSEDGLAFLRRIIAGDHPQAPMGGVLDFHLAEVEYGRALFRGCASQMFYNNLGAVHGGWAASLLDSALSYAVHATLSAGDGYTTVEFKVSLIRPITASTGTMHCEGRIIHRGRRLATAEAWLRDDEGRLFAHGSGSCMIFPARP
ncbi:PaaI family thioesterase [Propylenella binzhouense]|uniref:PaaI family thioesterase n=1 Tax=Propylenella binzhouense TaxID=2555902 RepID=A0A964T682_9HYPH|nr:PaaI family thioesterase [Propylenella binzhouense]MYZ48162.1 PaaI family thioesterase [Propylenella binzhouense]